MRAGVLDGDDHRVRGGRHGDLDRRVRCRVLERVGEGFLHDAVDGELKSLGETGEFALEAEGGGGARGPHPFHQGVQIGQSGLGRERGVVGFVVVDDGEQPAQFGEGAAPAVGDDPQRVRTPLRFRFGEPCRAAREADDHGEGVTEDVVHLPCHAGAFGRRGEQGALVALPLQTYGVFLEGLDVGVHQFRGQPQRGHRQDGDHGEERQHRGTGPLVRPLEAVEEDDRHESLHETVRDAEGQLAGRSNRPRLSSATSCVALDPESTSRNRDSSDRTTRRTKTGSGRCLRHSNGTVYPAVIASTSTKEGPESWAARTRAGMPPRA